MPRCCAYSSSLRKQAQALARPAVSFRLASCRAACGPPARARDFNHSSHSLSAVGLPSVALLVTITARRTTASLSYASPCVIVVSSSSFKRSVSFRHAFAAQLHSSFTGSLALCSLPLRPRSLLLLLSAARGCLPYPSLSIYFFDQLSYHLFPSRLRLSSQRVSQDKKVFEPVPFVRSAHSHQTSISLSQPPNLLAVSSALPRFHSPVFAYFTFPPLFL